MSESASLSLFDSLSQVPDPRLDRTKLHQLLDILVIAVCATICAAETWEELEEFLRRASLGTDAEAYHLTIS